MDGISPASCFLAANTAAGFYSVYEDLARPEKGDRVWYIKGGPGNGKSTFLRRAAAAAEAAGHHVEYILCSGDPGSLDGIYIRELKCAYVDATAPHVREPVLPGVSGRYLDLSQFYKNTDRIDPSALAALFGAYREQYDRAYALLAAAGKADPTRDPSLFPAEAVARLFEAGQEHGLRTVPEGCGGEARRRFLSANSCLGFLSLPGMAFANGRVWLIRGGLAHVWLSGAAEACKERNQRFILCPDPLDPERLDGLILPDAGISYLKAHTGVRYPAKGASRIDAECGSEKSGAYRQSKRLQNALLKEAYSRLASAKELHDELEALYRPAVDFKALDRFTAKHIKEHIR